MELHPRELLAAHQEGLLALHDGMQEAGPGPSLREGLGGSRHASRASGRCPEVRDALGIRQRVRVSGRPMHRWKGNGVNYNLH